MAAIYSPVDEGFDPSLEVRDRCQVGLLRELAGRKGGRLILKGGMAMRVAFGSLRLTKDIDFDAEESLTLDAIKAAIEGGLARAAAAGGMRGPRIDFTKQGKATVRARLAGALANGQEVRFEVEVSRRPQPAGAYLRSVVVAPARSYGMAPFPVVTYSDDALAAMKIAAALSDNRNAPRDLYDLNDLIDAGADPRGILARQDSSALRAWRQRVLGKLEMLSHPHARQELLPYLPLAVRQRLSDEGAWIAMTLKVAERVESFCADALAARESAGADRSTSPGGEAP